jgi:hypothetical protein
MTKMRREKIQIDKNRNEKGKVTTKSKETQGIIRDFLENLYSKNCVQDWKMLQD